jgi:hypothetical protein
MAMSYLTYTIFLKKLEAAKLIFMKPEERNTLVDNRNLILTTIDGFVGQK